MYFVVINGTVVDSSLCANNADLCSDYFESHICMQHARMLTSAVVNVCYILNFLTNIYDGSFIASA